MEAADKRRAQAYENRPRFTPVPEPKSAEKPKLAEKAKTTEKAPRVRPTMQHAMHNGQVLVCQNMYCASCAGWGTSLSCCMNDHVAVSSAAYGAGSSAIESCVLPQRSPEM